MSIIKIIQLWYTHRELITYVLFGGMTTGINVLSFYLMLHIVGTSYLLANAVAIGLSIVFAFVVNKLFVFQSKATSRQDIAREGFLFLFARGVSAGIDMLLMWLLVSVFGWMAMIAKIVTECLVVVMNYFASKYIIFRKEDEIVEEGIHA